MLTAANTNKPAHTSAEAAAQIPAPKRQFMHRRRAAALQGETKRRFLNQNVIHSPKTQ